MPVNSIIDVQNKIVFSRSHGVLLDQEMIAHEKWLFSHEHFDSEFGQFVDASDVTENRITPDGIRLASKLSSFSENARRVYLINDHLAMGYSNMHGHLTTMDTNNFLTTLDVNKACSWLGITKKLYLIKLEALKIMAKDNGQV